MGHYTRGDVVIAPLTLGERDGTKTRPAVVIGMTPQGNVYVCPVSSRPSSDAPSFPITLDDFSEGGLDIFNESFVLTSQVRLIQNGEVIGKRGRLTKESFESIVLSIPQSLIPDSVRKKGTGYLQSKR